MVTKGAKTPRPVGTLSVVPFSQEDMERSVVDRFEKVVRNCPEEIAVKSGDSVVTYKQLNAAANRLARTILARKGNEARAVGLLFENGFPLAAAMLGVLKTGKFFVALDPSFPEARIAKILEDSQAELLITDNGNIPLARKAARGDSTDVMEFESIDPATPSDDLHLEISPDSVANIVYTSGSTGEPKGVVWDHRGALHKSMIHANATQAAVSDRVSLLTCGTGGAITTVFVSLLSGSCLLPFDIRKEGITRLAQWLLREKISIAIIAAPLFRRLCQSLDQNETFPDVRLLRLAFEAVYKTDIDLFNKHFRSDCIFAHGLSSTETGPLTMYMKDADTDIQGIEIPVGYALEDMEILLLDGAGNKVGINQVGEIVVRSRYISRGYWNRPELTASKFNPDLVDGKQSLYRTGDLGLMLPDGCLIHKGRKDFRVKVRGFGVEVAEVEKAVMAYPGIQDVVVVPRQNEMAELL